MGCIFGLFFFGGRSKGAGWGGARLAEMTCQRLRPVPPTTFQHQSQSCNCGACPMLHVLISRTRHSCRRVCLVLLYARQTGKADDHHLKLTKWLGNNANQTLFSQTSPLLGLGPFFCDYLRPVASCLRSVSWVQVTSRLPKPPRCSFHCNRDTNHVIRDTSSLPSIHQLLTIEPSSSSNASQPQTPLPGIQNAKMPAISTLQAHTTTILKVIRPTFPQNFFHRLRRYLPRPTCLLLHWTYFITTCMLSSVIFWHFSTPNGSVSYIDALFMVVAALTQAGLNTINLSGLNSFQQGMLFVLIIIGNPIFISAIIIHVRKRAFHTRFKKAAQERAMMEKRSPIVWHPSFAVDPESAIRSRQALHCASSSFFSSRL